MTMPREAFSRENINRFWAKSEWQGECLVWTGTIAPNGYGKVSRGNRMLNAHRLAYELTVAEIPEGRVIDHLCRNRRCLRPAHLEVVTQRENVIRGLTGNRTACIRGHAYTPENTRLANGWRSCWECRRTYRARKAAAA